MRSSCQLVQLQLDLNILRHRGSWTRGKGLVHRTLVPLPQAGLNHLVQTWTPQKGRHTARVPSTLRLVPGSAVNESRLAIGASRTTEVFRSEPWFRPAPTKLKQELRVHSTREECTQLQPRETAGLGFTRTAGPDQAMVLV